MNVFKSDDIVIYFKDSEDYSSINIEKAHSLITLYDSDIDKLIKALQGLKVAKGIENADN